MFGKIKVAALLSALLLGALVLSCSEDSNYDQRAVLYVSSINEGKPFLSDVLNQGDSLWNRTRSAYKTDDDFITEDRVQVVFHNKPYNKIVDPSQGALGNFLVTGYDVEFIPLGGAPVPVQPFSGRMSTLVPANEEVTAEILLVPYGAKVVDPLFSLEYNPNVEIMTHARIIFHGEEVQTNRKTDFEAMVTVNFADPLTTKNQQNQ
jgi:hypothetical protein